MVSGSETQRKRKRKKVGTTSYQDGDDKVGQAAEVGSELTGAALSLRCLFRSQEEANGDLSLESGREAWLQTWICVLSLLLHTQHRPSVLVRVLQKKGTSKSQMHRLILRN